MPKFQYFINGKYVEKYGARLKKSVIAQDPNIYVRFLWCNEIPIQNKIIEGLRDYGLQEI